MDAGSDVLDGERGLRRGAVRLAVCLGIVVISVAASAIAFGSAPSIHVKPTTVDAGDRVDISGSADGCPVGDRVTLLSRAFSHRHEFAGVPAVYARVKSGGKFGVSPRIPAGRKPGRYSITARCGGGNLGVQVSLHVLRS